MFIKRQQHPSIEFSPVEGQQAPTLVHYFSDRGDPFKSVLPLLMEERVFVVESPLAEVVNWTIDLHKHPDLMAGANPAFMARQLGHSVEMFFRVYSKWIDGQNDDKS